MAGDAIRAQLADASRVLLLGSNLRGNHICHKALAAHEKPRRIIGVTYTQSPERWLRTHHLQDENAESLAVLDVGGQRSSNRAFADGGLTNVETVPNPGDLTGLGIALNRQFERFEDASGDLLLCFDSITALLQYADLETAYRFLHVLTTQLDHSNGVGFFHIDPGAHDDKTLHTLLSLFDASIDTDDETGEYTVSSR